MNRTYQMSLKNFYSSILFLIIFIRKEGFLYQTHAKLHKNQFKNSLSFNKINVLKETLPLHQQASPFFTPHTIYGSRRRRQNIMKNVLPENILIKIFF